MKFWELGFDIHGKLWIGSEREFEFRVNYLRRKRGRREWQERQRVEDDPSKKNAEELYFSCEGRRQKQEEGYICFLFILFFVLLFGYFWLKNWNGTLSCEFGQYIIILGLWLSIFSDIFKAPSHQSAVFVCTTDQCARLKRQCLK